LSTRLLKAAALQWDVRRGDVAHNVARAEALAREAAAAGARLLVLPEMWATSFVQNPPAELVARSDSAVERLRALSAELEVVAVGSALEQEAGAIYNRALVMDRGAVALSYRKIHLFTPTGEPSFFKAGDALGVVETSVGRVGVLICYDIRFPELTRLHFIREVEILVVPAQWPVSRAVHWTTLLRARALENQCFAVGANRCGVEEPLRGATPLEFPGDSAIVDPSGEVVAAGDGSEGAIVAEMNLKQIQTIRRLLTVRKDRRDDVYRRIWGGPPFTV
jgi:predicted amidohydrolase